MKEHHEQWLEDSGWVTEVSMRDKREDAEEESLWLFTGEEGWEEYGFSWLRERFNIPRTEDMEGIEMTGTRPHGEWGDFEDGKPPIIRIFRGEAIVTGTRISDEGSTEVRMERGDENGGTTSETYRWKAPSPSAGALLIERILRFTQGAEDCSGLPEYEPTSDEEFTEHLTYLMSKDD